MWKSVENTKNVKIMLFNRVEIAKNVESCMIIVNNMMKYMKIANVILST